MTDKNFTQIGVFGDDETLTIKATYDTWNTVVDDLRVGVAEFTKTVDEIENDIGHHGLDADCRGVVERLFADVVGIVAEDFFLARGEALFFFKAQHHRDVLVAVEAISDEEGDHDGILSFGHLRPVCDEGRLFHVSIIHRGKTAFRQRFDQLDLVSDRFGRILIQARAMAHDEKG